ncbi:beta-defensin 133-like isoform X1 [Peromyscus eremicus]|uniref:beta-defensin 133-like isoform X1 n=1 Tax=Peromyscus eremicus TaxID=42410 RepID=UPI0027DAD10A|nr:beta-defensin 133-like isoform X1 [Peromyscus eremicus]
MKLPALLLILFCFLDLLCTVKADMKDTYFCFFKRGKCRHVCKSVERKAGFCTKLNANCCMFAPEMKALYPEDQSTIHILTCFCPFRNTILPVNNTLLSSSESYFSSS